MYEQNAFKSAEDAIDYVTSNKLNANIITVPPILEDVTDEEELGENGFQEFLGEVEIEVSDDEWTELADTHGKKF